MEISPQRVRSAEFKTVRKGADPGEVKALLGEVADELERAQNQATAMEARARAAVARLQELSENPAAPASSTSPAAPAATAPSSEEAETISRTLLLAQRTADNAVAEARAEAERLLDAANNEATTTIDGARETSQQMIEAARKEARDAGEGERLRVKSEVEALKARRDFLESDVEQLELFLVDQRSRMREAASALVDITERVPGGIGEARPPLLSAAVDDDGDRGDDRGEAPEPSPVRSGDAAVEELVIVADLADSTDAVEADATSDPAETSSNDEQSAAPSQHDRGSDLDGDPTEALPRIVVRDDGASDDDGDDAADGDDNFLFSFDDNRR